MYIDHVTGQILEQPPDPLTGLYVVDRNDRVLHVRIPDDCCAVHIGECTQICTGGAVTATPHCVRGCDASSVARVSLVCYIDVKPSTKLSMPENCPRERVLAASMPSARVPPLEKRWVNEDMTFGEFLASTFEMYYGWTKSMEESKE
jgi:isopenicillin N synthase-like dioxygenase